MKKSLDLNRALPNQIGDMPSYCFCNLKSILDTRVGPRFRSLVMMDVGCAYAFRLYSQVFLNISGCYAGWHYR